MPERIVPDAGMSEETLEHHIKRYEFALAFVEGKEVLSIACGSGYGEHMLAIEGKAKHVIGADVDADAVEYAKSHYQSPNLAYQVFDATSIGLPDCSVDVVVSFETIEHINDDRRYLKEVHRVLKPDGVALISTPNRAKSWKNYLAKKPLNPYHVREYLPSQFASLLNSQFNEVQLYGQKTIIKRRPFLLLYYVLCKLTGKQLQIEARNYEIVPYPDAPLLETAIMVGVCKGKKH